jgi:hypothetical protein
MLQIIKETMIATLKNGHLFQQQHPPGITDNNIKL